MQVFSNVKPLAALFIAAMFVSGAMADERKCGGGKNATKGAKEMQKPADAKCGGDKAKEMKKPADAKCGAAKCGGEKK